GDSASVPHASALQTEWQPSASARRPISTGTSRRAAPCRFRRKASFTGAFAIMSPPNRRWSRETFTSMNEKHDWKPTLDDLAQRREAARAMGGEDRLAKHPAPGKPDGRARRD